MEKGKNEAREQGTQEGRQVNVDREKEEVK